MHVISAADIDRVMDFKNLVEELRRGFRENIVAPIRHHHVMAVPDGEDNHLLVMPAWTDRAAGDPPEGAFTGIKIVTVCPDNPATYDTATVLGSYLLNSGQTGAPLAIVDGVKLTVWRTAAASALAADYLARPDACRLTMVGAGAMAPYLIRAHSALRPIEEVRIWNRSAARAEALADRLRGEGVQASPASDLQSAVETADIVSCATVSSEPLVRGAWLKPGAHLDLVGAFRPDLRESDDEAVRRAALYADTRAGVLAEGGDIIQPVKAGVIEESDILGDLHDLTAGRIAGRRDADQITLFKSVGTALEDLVAARYLYGLKQAAG